MTKDVEHIFMYSLTIHIASSAKGAGKTGYPPVED
jgi:hypothetical protein